VQYEIFREITPETLAGFDEDQNISNFKENNNIIIKVYGSMGYLSSATNPVADHVRRQKKGCATRTPNPNREP
jgi:hypothetical protein